MSYNGAFTHSHPLPLPVSNPTLPLLPFHWQVLEWVMSYDGVNSPEPLAITAAGAALLVSGRSWGPCMLELCVL